VALYSLSHVIDLEWMREAYRLTRKSDAPGIDGVVAAEYESNLEANLQSLLGRIRSGSYKAPPVRRAYIPKADGSQRPLGIPTFEDKMAQRAISMVLEAIYEQDFYPCSYGFRPGRSAHQALQALRTGFMTQGLRWVLDVDIRKYFDSIPHKQLREFLDRRVTDGVIRRLIDRWLKAGVMEEGQLRQSTEGSPQGGVISPLLSNIYLHHVLDEWFETEVRPRLKGRCTLVRYADDLVMAFEDFLSAKRVLAVLGKRLARYGLTLHPEKTRFIDFRFKRPNGMRHAATSDTTFDFLGFTHARRKFHEIHVVHASPTTTEALARIGALYAIEEEVRGKPADLRLSIRQARARPLLAELRAWMQKAQGRLSSKSETAGAIRYALARWHALTRYADDGLLEIDNSAAERALRAVALGRKSFLFVGSDGGGERAAAMYSLIGSAKLNGLNPELYLRTVLARIADHPISRIGDLLPWNLVDQLKTHSSQAA